jgi:hypothetical protein
MKRTQVRAQIRAHELAAARNPIKRQQHQRSIAWYRKRYGLPTPPTFGRDPSGRGAGHTTAALRAEAERIRNFKSNTEESKS